MTEAGLKEDDGTSQGRRREEEDNKRGLHTRLSLPVFSSSSPSTEFSFV